ncbi:hypothetical protein [Kutzneria kofuensis]|uniref:hypothetical protein n=1 Tax=Kutzneria kofuensis TaxID=103725 RepID=UPI0031ED9450
MRSSVLLAAALMIISGTVVAVPAQAAPSFPACQHFYTGPIPDRPVTGGHGPGTLVPPVDVSGRLSAPGGVSGGISGSTVTFTFKRWPARSPTGPSATARRCSGSATGASRR